MKQLLLLGGGHSHVEVIRRLGRRSLHGTKVTLASPDRYATYSGMLPGLIAGHYGFHDCHIDLKRLCEWAGVDFKTTTAEHLDVDAQRVHCSDGANLGFDLVSLDIGSVPDVEGTPGAAAHATGVKPPAILLSAVERLLVRASTTDRPLSIAVVGGGAGGVELVLALHHRLVVENGGTAEFHLLTDTHSILQPHGARVTGLFERILIERSIQAHTGSRVVQVSPGLLLKEDSAIVPADIVIWAIGAGAPRLIRESGVATDERGFLAVNECLRSVSHAAVFAAGDVASLVDRPHPKSGVYAVRHGPILHENLRRTLTGQPLIPYRPQKGALALISTGDRCAVASWRAFAFAGKWVWTWKDLIDRRFVAKYNELAMRSST